MPETHSFYPWQQSVWKALYSSNINTDQFPHALLLSGISGIGKTDLAFFLARGLLCQSPQLNPYSGEIEPCQQHDTAAICRSCRLFLAGNHPDLKHLSTPEDKKVIPVDDIREVIQWSVLNSQMDGKKIILIEPAEAMNQNASNSLLKTLEEPVSQTIIILVSHQKQALLPTIRSRCLNIDLALPEHLKALKWLEQQLEQPLEQPLEQQKEQQKVEQAELMLSLASGAPLFALQLAQGEQLEIRHTIIRQLLEVANDALDPVELAESLFKQMKPKKSSAKKSSAKKTGNTKKSLVITPYEVIYWMDSIVTDLARLAQNCTSETISNMDYYQNLQQLINRLYLKKLLQLSDLINKAYYEIQGQININLLYEKLLIDWKNCK